MSDVPSAYEAVARKAIDDLLSDGPVELHLINPANRPSPETLAARDPELQHVFSSATRIFTDTILQDQRPCCFLCKDVTWQADITKNPVRPGGIAIACTAQEFRQPDQPIKMMTLGLCTNCTQDRSTLRVRLLDALKPLWPNTTSFPASLLAPMSASRN